MSIFAGIKDAKTQEKNYLSPGDYTIGIVAVKHIQSQKNRNQEFFVVEGIVEEAAGKDAQTVGSFISWVANLTGNLPEKAMEDVNQFLKAATGATDSEITEEFVLAVVEEDGATLADAGTSVVCHTWEKITKAGNPFWVVEWGNDGSKMSAAETMNKKNNDIPF